MGVNERQLRQAHRHSVDGEVAASEVTFQSVAVFDLGLSRPHFIRISAIGRHFDDKIAAPATDGAELAADVPG